MAGIYIHIPFCLRKCSYCDFVSIPYDEETVSAYMESLEKEMEQFFSGEALGLPPRTLYIGGGTPSLLSPSSFLHFMESLCRFVPILSLEEVTLEANPGTLNPEKLSCYRKSGVSRISIGAQSFHEETLRTLGRIHTVRDIHESFNFSKDASIQNISLDIMFGTPGQSVKGAMEDLSLATSLSPSHISLYALSVEEGTPLHDEVSRGLKVPSGDECGETYYSAIRFLENCGYRHYEISNFAREGCICLHNKGYWSGEEYVAFGAGASGYIRNDQGEGMVRYRNHPDVRSYIQSISLGESPRTQVETIDSTGSWRERLIMGLRMIEGICLDEIEESFGPTPPEVQCSVNRLIEEGKLTLEGRRILVPERFLFTSNEILSYLV
jgi:oxygen-independent coproporphyrinogen-3 oxidase